jgi:hypothetical protein
LPSPREKKKRRRYQRAKSPTLRLKITTYRGKLPSRITSLMIAKRETSGVMPGVNPAPRFKAAQVFCGQREARQASAEVVAKPSGS